MKTYSFVLFSSSLFVLSAVIGCAGGTSAILDQESPRGYDSAQEQNAVVKQDVASEPAAMPTVGQTTYIEPSETLVGSMTTPQPPTPSLIDLPASSDLDEAIATASGTIILDFYADWCGPCRSQGKILRDLESTAAQKQALIVKVNVDQHPELAEQLQVSALPTLMVVKNGQLVHRQTGMASKKDLVNWMQ
ncbi:Thioredoxin [Novipirellula aureliae]|uniref:Thioredoxin n=1 Tax=Novipirellula aureliae TaxID=2527966 RepID=A0A5C6E0M5_9BACT|nr:thioredoxin family protein [Novipirellula aureliae]TWU43243.1 Thioredoxin [Novipirellula aureliae]